ncbi:hypothetical protein MHU86_7340 [Fragilaria crotonensis]|nr:hypothetical protein MHU86_17557 [Fragilaria crotonensis]KAI2507071.1 hypothetical protein MHU86_7340 [Fragilaria crotonensis]
MIADASSGGATALFGCQSQQSSDHGDMVDRFSFYLNSKPQTKPNKAYRPGSGLPLKAMHSVKGWRPGPPLASERLFGTPCAMRFSYIQHVLGDTTNFKKAITFIECIPSLAVCCDVLLFLH